MDGHCWGMFEPGFILKSKTLRSLIQRDSGGPGFLNWAAVPILTLLLSCFCACGVLAKDIYVDSSARQGGDGSKASPFSTVSAALSANPGPGNRFLLQAGFYGALRLMRTSNVVFEGVGPETIFSSIHLSESDDVALQSLSVHWDRNPPEPSGRLVKAFKNVAIQTQKSDGTRIENITIRSTDDGVHWTKDDWLRRSASGIFVRGDDAVIRNNVLTFVRVGITVVGSKGLIEANTVAHFSGDGLRAIGDHNVIQDNLVHSCYQIDHNHDDGFQSWSVGADGRPGTGVTKGTIVRRNKIFSYVKPGHPLQCSLQGIGLFDGFYEDWLIENNIVSVDHWHAISVTGARNVVIRNNTVVDPTFNKTGPGMIRIFPHKDGRPSENTSILNNLIPRSKKQKTTQAFLRKSGVHLQGNTFYGNPRNIFVDPEGFDFSLNPKSYGIDRAVGELPPDDITGAKRPWGEAGDVGAYEYRGE